MLPKPGGRGAGRRKGEERVDLFENPGEIAAGPVRLAAGLVVGGDVDPGRLREERPQERRQRLAVAVVLEGEGLRGLEVLHDRLGSEGLGEGGGQGDRRHLRPRLRRKGRGVLEDGGAAGSGAPAKSCVITPRRRCGISRPSTRTSVRPVRAASA